MSLAVENISAGYDRVPVLKDVSLKVEQGNICALMGRNGSGKTTVLRCINAILKPTQGRVIADGRRCTQPFQNRDRPLDQPGSARHPGSFLFLLPGNDPDGFGRADPCMVGPGKQRSCKRRMEILDEVGIRPLATSPV